MRGLLLLPLLFLFVGCASYTYHHLTVKGSGTYILSGLPVQGNAIDESWTCLSIFKCPTLNEEVLNVVQYQLEDDNAVNH